MDKGELSNTPINAAIASFKAMNSDQLRKELENAISITADQITKMAAIIRVLEDRGEDLSFFRTNLGGYLRSVAYGQILPEIVARFQLAPLLMRKAASLTHDQQRKLLSGSIEVAELAADGSVTHRNLDPTQLGRDQLNLVLARDHIRSLPEQTMVLNTKSPEIRRRQRRSASDVLIDTNRGGIVVDGMFIPRADLARYLAKLSE